MQINSKNSEAIKRKYPESVILIIVKDEKGKYNPTPCSWATTVSRDPLMFAVSIAAKRYSLEAIRQKGEFVIAFPSELMGEEILFYGTNSGMDIDKFFEKSLATKKAETVDSLLLEEGVANFECIFESEHPAGDHIIVIGRVLKAWENNDSSVKRLFNTASGYKLSGVRTEKTSGIF